MEITTMQMYWLVMLDSINIGSFVMCVLIAVAFISLIAIAMDSYECPLIAKILMPILVVLFVALFSVCVFLPGTKQMAAIMIVPKIANSEKVKTVGNKVYDLAVEWMEELKPNKKESEVKNDTCRE
jgi:SNF family Na+-dependent transporter